MVYYSQTRFTFTSILVLLIVIDAINGGAYSKKTLILNAQVEDLDL